MLFIVILSESQEKYTEENNGGEFDCIFIICMKHVVEASVGMSVPLSASQQQSTCAPPCTCAWAPFRQVLLPLKR